MSNKVGRPLKFETVEELEKKIEDYFRHCEQNELPYTVSRLAYELGCSRQTLLTYGEKDEFLDTIKKAKAKIEFYNEEQLYINPRTAGVIFNLKNNFGWKDKQEVDWKGEFKIGKITKEDAQVVKDTFDKITE